MDGMSHIMLSMVLIFSFFFLLNTTIEIYKRNRRSPENRFAALTTLSIAIMFFSEYMQQVSPSSWVISIAAYGVYPAALLSAGISALLHIQVTRAHNNISMKAIYFIALLPMIIYFVLLGYYGKAFIVSGFVMEGIWRAEKFQPGIFLVLFILLFFSILNVAVCIRAWRRSSVIAKKKYFFLTSANFCYQAFAIFMFVISQFPSIHIPEHTVMFSTLIWGITIRIFIIKYNFLPSAERKFELLHEISPLAIVLLNQNGIIQEANPSAEKLFGAKVGELANVCLSSFIPEDEREAFLQQFSSDFPEQAWTNKELSITNLHQSRKTLIADMIILWDAEEWSIFGVIQDITERKAKENYIAHLAHHDALTQLPNRLYYSLKLDQSFEKVCRSGGWLAVMMIDLDRFKIINDRYGHQRGDEVLLVVADRLREVTGPNNMVARLGGDEFIILMPEAKEYEDVVGLAEDLLRVFQLPVKLQDKDFFLGISIGISLYPSDGDDTTSLIRKADMAMYEAKARGGNQYRLYAKEMDCAVWRYSEMDLHLRKALERKELCLYYQPQFSFSDGKLTGMEALIRWNSDKLGAVQPSEFIPIAEHTGVILEIGQWVLREACEQAAQWIGEGHNIVMSVNISSRQFMQPDFVAMVEEVLQSTGLDPCCLCLEITESTVINHLDVARQMLDQLVQKGIKIAIDDFGTGYSSLSVLKQLPVSIIKIDRSFVNDMEQDASIVRAIISMGHDLQKEIVSEGVEDERQYELLRQMRCDTGQGYLMSKPLPVEAVEALLAASKFDDEGREEAGPSLSIDNGWDYDK